MEADNVISKTEAGVRKDDNLAGKASAKVTKVVDPCCQDRYGCGKQGRGGGTEGGHRLQSSAQNLSHAAVELAAKCATPCRRPRKTWFTEARKGSTMGQHRGEDHAQKAAHKLIGQ